MGYKALLFCLDQKNARTVTQVLTELEFAVEPCPEPFAAVKKLMAQHFDAVVVDCENEQNATLLFRSARNSASNSGSLAVAVVEGQAGVAKAFRIGANLVLTKPINVEQAKGTLRVARGLLRKSEAAKADGPAASAPIPRGGNGATPFAAKPAPQTASSHPPARSVSREDDVLGLDVSSAPLDMPANTDDEEAVATPAWPQGMDSKPGSPGFGGGAAIAPAPARVPEIPAITAHGASKKTSEAEPSFEKPAAENEVSNRGSERAVPTFTFGGTNLSPEPAGSGKKAIIAIAAAVLVAAGAYAGWRHFQTQSAPASDIPQQTAPASTNQTAAPSSKILSALSPASPSNMQPGAHSKKETTGGDSFAESLNTSERNGAVSVGKLGKPSAAVSSPEKPEDKPEAEPTAEPIVVKSGSRPLVTVKRTVSDAPAPSMVGIAQPGSGGTLSNLIPEADQPKPVLQTLNISQGVSQGLLTKKVQPTYPANALHMRVEGSVELTATISKSGNISSVKVLSGPPLLAQAALDAVKQWKYKPYLLNGEPVEIQTQITINFRLPR